MQNNYLTNRFLRALRPILNSRSINLEKLETESALDLEAVDEEARQREDVIEAKRNKSRLQAPHRNMLHGKVPYIEPQHWIHGTLKYQRKVYAKCGAESNFNPSLCWPTKKELAFKMEYERIAYPYTVPELMERAKKARDEKNERVHRRQEEITAKMVKLEAWKSELRQKIDKKETDAMAAKDRKERLIEEVRRHFGYTVDPREDRFKELLEKKEKEQKKVMKEARKKAKEDKMITKMTSTTPVGTEDAPPEEEVKKNS